ncbi:MAG: DUF1802 family protein [Miltoncostaeaceae bacterium]
MAEHALKEWAVTVEALARGDQVLIIRKGGIGEKSFSLPHSRFFLFPTYEHQRPELVKDAHRDDFRGALEQREDPDLLPLPAFAELIASHPIADPDALDALDPLHILTPDYAAERLRWRRKHPLWAAVLRVWRCVPPPVLPVGSEHGGCVSWIDLPGDIAVPELAPALDDAAFRHEAGAVERVLAELAAT